MFAENRLALFGHHAALGARREAAGFIPAAVGRRKAYALPALWSWQGGQLRALVAKIGLAPFRMEQITERFLATLRRTPALPRERLQEYQFGLLERLVRHARETVPFYRDSRRLDPIFAANGTIDWSRWKEIPALSRRDVQQNFHRLISENLPAEHGSVRPVSTSGTTGEPVTVLHSELTDRHVWTALTLRDFENHNIDATKHLAYLYPFTPEDFAQKRARIHHEWYQGFAALGLAGTRSDISDMTPATALVEQVTALKPDYLRVQPVALELMAAQDRDDALARARLQKIICVGEYFADGSKSQIERQLSCDIVMIYGSSECGRMASSCPECGRYHVNAETVFLEVVRENGADTVPGEAGSVLATPLYNYAMPLIRYDHADEASVGETGRCSSRLPVLDSISGKRRLPFVFGDGTTIRPAIPVGTLVEFLGAQAFQFAQTAPDRCELRFVPGSLSKDEMQFERMTEFLRSIWWNGLTIDYRIVDRITPRTTPAKSAQFVQEMRGASDSN